MQPTWRWLLGIQLLVTSGTWVLPLARELQYEFSAVLALSFSLMTGLTVVTARELHPIRLRPSSPAAPDDARGDERGDERRELHRLVGTVILISLVPLAVEILHALVTRECGLVDGVAWYLLLASPAAVISLLLGLLCRIVTRRRWLRVLLFLAIWSGSLLRGGVEAYSGPHIYLYAWQVGFFPGGSWDPELPISLRLILYRLAQLALAAGLFTVIAELRRISKSDPAPAPGPAPILLTSLAATAVLLLIPFRAELGLTRTSAWLRQELGDSLRTQHATIYFDRAATDSLALWRAAELTDFYIERHAALLGISPDRIGPVTFYLHPSAERQKEYVGTSSASFTKPWLRMLNIPEERVGDVLEHELAHIAIAPFGRVLGISLSQGLLEGAAVAMTGDEGWLTLHEYAEAADRELSPPPIDRIMGTGGFTSINTSLAYLLAGSFSRWLIDTYGIRRYLALYGSDDYEGTYGASLETMAARYRSFLATQHPPVPPSKGTLRYFYGGGSFFAQRCLRRLAMMNRRGYERLAEERYDDAIAAFRESMADGGISTSARLGMLRSLAGLGRYRTVLDSMRVYLADSLWEPFLPSLVDAGDAHWALGEPDSASAIYRRVLGYGVSTTLSTRTALRLYFIEASPALAGMMRTYFTRSLDPVERVDLLRRARRLASDPERRILDLMAASWTYSRYPAYTLAGLADDSLVAGSRLQVPPAGPASRRETLALFAEESLRATLADLSLYGLLLRSPGTRGGEMVAPGFPSGELRRAVATWLPGVPLPSPRSENEERTERRALIEFALRHPVLP